jgi:hypothetical protein
MIKILFWLTLTVVNSSSKCTTCYGVERKGAKRLGRVAHNDGIDSILRPDFLDPCPCSGYY